MSNDVGKAAGVALTVNVGAARIGTTNEPLTVKVEVMKGVANSSPAASDLFEGYDCSVQAVEYVEMYMCMYVHECEAAILAGISIQRNEAARTPPHSSYHHSPCNRIRRPGFNEDEVGMLGSTSMRGN